MTREIPKEQWKGFCEQISRERLDWKTSIQVLSDETGAQMLSQGLPFVGIALEDENGSAKIELITGTGASIHQTHSIFNPSRILIEFEKGNVAVLDIEDDSGTKTLVSFIEAASLPATVEKSEIVQIS